MFTPRPLDPEIEAAFAERERQKSLARADGCDVGVRARKYVKANLHFDLQPVRQGRGDR